MLGRTNTGGGGVGGLNFQVIGSATAPNNPKENTIWIETDTNVTSWIFSAVEPSAPSEGMVWIFTGTSSPVEFNALKKNGLQVYPVAAKQYIDGEWVDKAAKSFRGGAWVDWWDGVLYNAGNTYDDITGGYSGVGDYISATNSDGRLNLHVQNGATAALITEQAINLTGFKTLKVTGYGTSANCFAGIVSNRSVNFSSTVVMENQGTYALDISSVEGLFYVGLMGRVGNKVYADKIWLER